ncbi:unnamed protein product, partial [Aureobasidium vineae]
MDLRLGRKLRFNVQEATCSQIDGRVVVKLARFSWEMPQLEQETQAYEWIKDTDIGPAFLAHLTEKGRTIGSVMEHIANARHAELEDLPLCRAALDRLHKLGIKYGDVNKHNILIRDEGVTLIDLDCAILYFWEESCSRLSQNFKTFLVEAGPCWTRASIMT